MIPVIGQGTWMMERDPQESIRAIRAGLDLGLTHIDTAEMYGGGQVEEIVGRAIEGRRDEVFLASKVLPSNARHSRTIEACERSLQRLGTDRLDLYLLHWPSRHPLEETIAAFADLKRAGKIRAFGVSNFDVPEVEEAVALAGYGHIACNQVLYHLKERRIEYGVLPLCEELGISVVGYSPFGQGDFPERNPVLAEIAILHDVTPRQVALAFLVRRPSLFTIPKSSNAAHVEENAGAGNLVLDAAAVERIERAFPLGPRKRRLPTL
ncbi:MAG: aldo/keto reductase [Actinomycetota bacterium]|nr:aldo/keto reductase [Actinomycetota bacterium]